MSTTKISFPGIEGAVERQEQDAASGSNALYSMLKQSRSTERVAQGKVHSSRNQIVLMYSAKTQQVTPS